MRVANAPCSWGILEFESTAQAPGPAQVLDEIAGTGYDGTELGDWGFFATDPAILRNDLAARSLSLVGAFVPVALSDPSAHAAGEALALKTARLLRDTVGDRDRLPAIVLSDATAAVPSRTAKAGRITPPDGLTPDRWRMAAEGIERIAHAVRDATALRTVFHHHCATYVETPEEIDTLMRMTPADLVGLCVDTGHATYGGGNPLEILTRHRSRVWHVHFKDCAADVAARARREGWDYIEAVRNGLFCELGEGTVDFAAIVEELRRTHYDGWIVVEQDVLPGSETGAAKGESTGTPAERAARNRAFLRRSGV